jgi:hypothetical protein
VLVWADRGIQIDWPALPLDTASSIQKKLQDSQVKKDEKERMNFPVEPASILRYLDDHPEVKGKEREIHDLFGLVPEGHPDLRRLALHQFWPDGYHPLRHDVATRSDFADAGQPFPFQHVEGEGIFEITVGPVHAGIIEPGHFRFSVEGETIVNLETRLGFVHKGTEKLFETLPFDRTVELAERVSGDTTVGHALAYCQALEAARISVGIHRPVGNVRPVLPAELTHALRKR